MRCFLASGFVLAAVAALFAAPAQADDRTQRLVERLQEEAYAFQQIATDVIGTEVLNQLALEPPRRFRFRIRVGNSNEPRWQKRELVSEYGFSRFSDGALHELRQARTVDGKKVKGGMSVEELADLVLADDDDRKLELLKQFEKNGLAGGANDFGQIILLFMADKIERYEFVYDRPDVVDKARVERFRYKQIDAGESLTLVNERKREVQDFDLQGYLYVRPDDYSPVRISVDVRQTAFDELERDARSRQRVDVYYEASRFGAVLPSRIDHWDYVGDNIVAENHFTYSDFQKFGASTEINFEIADPVDGEDPGAGVETGPGEP